MKTNQKASLKKDFKQTFGVLKDNHQKVLLRRLEGGKKGSFESIAKDMGVTPARIYQIEQAAWLQIEAQINAQKVDHEGLKLSELDEKLSPRTLTALRKNNIVTLKDLFSLNKDNLFTLKGIGRKSFKEITRVATKVTRQKQNA